MTKHKIEIWDTTLCRIMSDVFKELTGEDRIFFLHWDEYQTSKFEGFESNQPLGDEILDLLLTKAGIEDDGEEDQYKVLSILLFRYLFGTKNITLKYREKSNIDGIFTITLSDYQLNKFETHSLQAINGVF